jgi:hypothetical protein
MSTASSWFDLLSFSPPEKEAEAESEAEAEVACRGT